MTTLERISPGMRSVLPGLALAMLTILLGQGMGIVFGLNEDAIKGRLKSSAMEVRATAYKGDDAAIREVLDKSWVYMQRAHLHSGSMGTTAFAFILFLGLVRPPQRLAGAVSVALGAGGLGYALYWMLAGFRAPGMGGTGPAKESLSWLAMPTSGAFVLATVTVLFILIGSILSGRKGAESGE
ncbi:MAG TPA: hypothetical protein VIK52_03235 [Opitutaceae bacterium]